MEKISYDVAVIGAGAVGCAAAYTLAEYEMSVCVIEKEADVASGASGRNSAVSHAGFNSKRDSRAAHYCVRGNRGLEAVCRRFNVPFKKTGKLIVAMDESDIDGLYKLVADGEYNGVDGLSIITAGEAAEYAPGIPCVGAMMSSNTAIFDPFRYAIALAENAAVNGVTFFFESPVSSITNINGGFAIKAGGHDIRTRYIVNAAGLFSGEILRMAGGTYYPIYPCRGEYYVLDKKSKAKLAIPVYPVPKPGIGGLGVHLTPTTGGNIIIGPSAEYIDDPEDYACTREVMDNLISEAKILFPAINQKDIIRSYSGIRAKLVSSGGFGDFIIGEDAKVPGMFNLIGTESPGLTSSLPLAEDIVGMIVQKCGVRHKSESRIKTRMLETPFNRLTDGEKHEKIKTDPLYGEIVCRCENITKAEIIHAIENPLGVRTLAGIKYRTRATMGRCQGGFCLTRIAAILTREYGMKPEEITYRGKGSELLAGKTK
ncbi:MAG: NAD(P)/FAD-dependent oxidoreductase [Oscillospiraceae bacterium]|nr:NAD(P)/FAD-dependent oxidoreductase [Oscillospiraceae bacterium]